MFPNPTCFAFNSELFSFCWMGTGLKLATCWRAISFFANLLLTLYYKKNESISLPQNCQKYKTAISAFKTKFLNF